MRTGRHPSQAATRGVGRIGSRARAMATVYLILILPVLAGFASLGVDYARVQMAKTQLYRAAFAAARAGAAGLSDGTASSKAIAMAANNLVDGTPLVLQASDVVTGTWSGGTFTPGGSSPNAIQINAYRIASRGTGIPLTFGQVLGFNTCNIHCTNVIATASNSTPSGFVGLTSFPVNKKLFAGSYASSVTTTPSHVSHNNNCIMQTNGVLANGIHAGGNLYGNPIVGPSGSVAGGLTVSGSTTTNATNITAPAVTMQVVSNPMGVPANETVPSSTVFTAPGGTYYLTSLTIGTSCTISFTGAATIYMDGNLTMGASNSLVAYNNIPANLVIYQSSGHTFTAGDGNTFVGVINAPGCNMTWGNNNIVRGAMLANNLTLGDNDDLYFDEDLGSTGGSATIGSAH